MGSGEWEKLGGYGGGKKEVFLSELRVFFWMVGVAGGRWWCM